MPQKWMPQQGRNVIEEEEENIRRCGLRSRKTTDDDDDDDDEKELMMLQNEFTASRLNSQKRRTKKPEILAKNF